MTQLTVGRAFDGLDVAPATIGWTGDTLTLAGRVKTTSYDILQATRDRIVALAGNREEPVVPLTFTVDPAMDGYYQVLGSACNLFSDSPTTFYGDWQIDLRRAGGGATPQLEVYGLHSARTNPHSITNATLNGSTYGRLVAIPERSVDFYEGAASTLGANRVADVGGDVSLWSVTQSLPTSVVATFTLAPAYAYDGACSIRTTYGAATNQLVTGMSAPGRFDGGWIMSNELVRVSIHPSINTAIQVEVFSVSSTWVTMASGVGWRVEHDYGGGSTKTWDLYTAPVTILRNSPEVCSIRLALAEAATVAQFGRVWLDLTLRRGDRFVCGVMRCDTLGGLGGLMALEPTSSIAATAQTGGVRATSNDSNSNRAVWGVAGSAAVSNDLTTGRITQSAGATPMPFMVGVELNGSGAATANVAQQVLYQYYDIRNETQRVVRR